MLGGPGAEREVSLRSGNAVISALRRRGHCVTEIDPVGTWKLPADIDVVFLALHGRFGEDGTVQRQLEKLKVAYTGSGVEASALAFDKALSKARFRSAGVKVAEDVLIKVRRSGRPAELELPLVLKPVAQGSSVGLSFVMKEEDWDDSLAKAFEFGGSVLCERMVQGREVTVGVLGDATLPIVEILPKSGFYDYQNKYTTGATDYFCPAEFSIAQTERIQQAGRKAFECLGCRDYGRVDIIVDNHGEPVVLEVNTLPGMTETSLMPKAAAAAGIGYDELCQRMTELALKR